MKYGEHEIALLIECKKDDREALKVYLQSIVDQCEKDGFAGFTLLKAWDDPKEAPGKKSAKG